MDNCIQACPYNTLDGCKVKVYNAICPITNMATPFTEYRMTKADRIRAMSDEEMAEEISRISIIDLCDIIFGGIAGGVETFKKTSQQRCAEAVLKWLQQPVIGLRAGQPADCLEKSIAELKQDDQCMKELQIIIKRPYDGNPLNQQEGAESIPNGTMTVGWKFEADNGKLYGDYVILDQNTSDDVILEVIRLQLNQARETERAII